MLVLAQKTVALRLQAKSLGALEVAPVPSTFMGYKQKKALHIPGIGILLVYNSFMYGVHAALFDESLEHTQPLAESGVNIRNLVGHADIHFLMLMDADHENGRSRWLGITHEGKALPIHIQVETGIQRAVAIEAGQVITGLPRDGQEIASDQDLVIELHREGVNRVS